MRKVQVGGIALLAFLFACGIASAQTAQVTGVVKDESGAVVPGVTITARNSDTGLLRTTVTEAAGNFTVSALPPGAYRVSAELSGFGTSVTNIVLIIDQTVTLNLSIKPAALAETVTVSGIAPQVDVTQSEVSTSVLAAQMQTLPIASRRWIDLALLVPGTSQDGIRGQFYRGNVNIGAGARSYSNGSIVDGVNNTWAEMGEPRQNFAMDSIEEFKVSTSLFKAEYGLATGGVLSVVSKSGTNDFRGDGFLFFRDKALNSIAAFQATKPDYQRYQFGGAVGGPIIHDRTHFFVAYERTNENQYLTVSTGGVWPQYDGTYPSKKMDWNYTAKVDHQLTAQQHLFFRLAQENDYRPILTAGGTVTPTASFDASVYRSSAVVGDSWVLSSHALNDFRFQYAFAKYMSLPPDSFGAGPDHGGWAPGDFPTSRFALLTPQFLYPSLTVGASRTSDGPESRFEFKDDFSYTPPNLAGSHRLKAGVDYSKIPFQQDSTSTVLGAWTFPKDQPYNPNDRTTWPTQYTDSLPNYSNQPSSYFGVYGQDDWTPTSRLVLNLGFRWEVQPGGFNEDIPKLMQLIQDKLGPGFGYPLAIPFQNASQRGDWHNFGPRVGLAWDPNGNGRTNVHAGWGLYYDNMRILNNAGELTWPQSQTIVIKNPSYPDPFQGLTRSQFVSTAPPNITVLANDVVSPRAHQFNAGLTQNLFRDIAVSADVTAVNRYGDLDTVDQNLPDPVTHLRPFPQFGRVSTMQSSSNNTYRALLTKVEKRLNDHYQFMVSYTLSKAEDSFITNLVGSTYGFQRVTAPSPADRRHRIVASGIVIFPHELTLSAVADYRSSLPFNPLTSSDLNGDGYTGDLPPGVTWNNGCRGLDVGAINTFREAHGLSDVSSSAIACPTWANMDLRLTKVVGLSGSRKLNVIVQLLNVFDRAQFDIATSNPSSKIFGQSTQLVPFLVNAPSRLAEIALRYEF